jgi:hypothetical protein
LLVTDRRLLLTDRRLLLIHKTHGGWLLTARCFLSEISLLVVPV